MFQILDKNANMKPDRTFKIVLQKQSFYFSVFADAGYRFVKIFEIR